MQPITVNLLKPGKNDVVTYSGDVLENDGDHVLLLARWEHPPRDLGYVTFETGDLFYEHYYRTRWYNVCELRTPVGRLKGWYCNVTRPVSFDGYTLNSEDLELDLFVSPDRETLLRLDEDEFEARHFDAETRATALVALEEMEALARAGEAPFDGK